MVLIIYSPQSSASLSLRLMKISKFPFHCYFSIFVSAFRVLGWTILLLEIANLVNPGHHWPLLRITRWGARQPVDPGNTGFNQRIIFQLKVSSAWTLFLRMPILIYMLGIWFTIGGSNGELRLEYHAREVCH